jgi:23S rRNA (guanine745-N1)-methyltransferase
MYADVVPYLRCPICAGPLAADGDLPPGARSELASPAAAARPALPRARTRALRCPRGHSFDVARQGYVNLGAAAGGDTAEMVAARERFLGAGHYGFIAAALAAAALAGAPLAGAARPVARGDGELVVDAGAGTGHHLTAVLDAAPAAVGLALDASKPALRRAARAHPRAGAVLCDTWRRLPLADACASVMLNVFAPRNGPEFRRVLRPDGLLLVVTPEPDHLAELVDGLGLLRVDPEKPARVAAGLGEGFAATDRTPLRRTMRLGHADVLALVGMGPSAWHAEPGTLAARVARLPVSLPVTASVLITSYRART